MRTSVLLLTALAVAPISAAGLAPDLEKIHIEMRLRGYDDGVAHGPAAIVKGPYPLPTAAVPGPGDCPVGDAACASPVPRGQYHWLEARVWTSAGAPVADTVVVLSLDGFSDGAELRGVRTDGAGFGRTLLTPAVDNLAQAFAFLPDSSIVGARWLVAGETRDSTRPSVVGPEGQVVQIDFEVLEPAYLDVRTKGVSVAPADANAFLLHQVYEDEEGPFFEIGGFGAWSRHAHAAVRLESPAPVEIQEDFPLLFGDGTGGGFQVILRGEQEPGLRVRTVLGLVGLAESPDWGFSVFGPASAYRLTITPVGDMRAFAPSITGGETLAVQGRGSHAMSMEASGAVGETPGLVFAEAGITGDGMATFRVERGEERASRTVFAGSHLVAREGSCGGAWSAALDGYQGFETPSVVVAHAEGVQLPQWLRDEFGVPDGCGL